MRYLITGIGQIGTQLMQDLTAQGHEVVVVRRGSADVPGATTLHGDAGDAALLRRATEGVAGVFHCIHAPYDAAAWRRDLPGREAAVMEAAAEHGAPVIFPESVYAFGRHAISLDEGGRPQPCSPLGQVRAELLAARAAHRARTLSVVASDLLGPTTGAGAVGTTTVVRPVRAGRRAWVLGDADAPHSWSFVPDVSRAMIFAAEHAAELAPQGDAVLHAPTAAPRSLRGLAEDVATAAGTRSRVTSVPGWILAATRALHPTMRELSAQQYLWRSPAVLNPGALTDRFGLQPTEWSQVIASLT